MALDPVEEALLEGLRALAADQLPAADQPVAGQPNEQAALDVGMAATLFEAQVASRLVDHAAREMRTHGEGFYTIGSAGHESNAAVALALRVTDPALLHYRSGGFYMGRASQVSGISPIDDVLRGMFTSVHEPISGGRHKVFGRRELNIIPQTSTISSHLPRAVGLAASLARSNANPEFEQDSIVVCSIGDASLNHSTAQGALNAAANMAHRGQRVPLLVVVEDNGIGISTPTPADWVAQSTKTRWGLDYATAEGQDPEAVFATVAALAREMREHGRPGVLHLRTVRFMAHAGSDVEAAYRSAAEIRADYARDPILGSAKILVDNGECSGNDLADWYLSEREQVLQRAQELSTEPRLSNFAQVVAPLADRHPDQVADRASELDEVAASDTPLTLAQMVNHTLATAMSRSDDVLVFGQDVAKKGGVYGVTRGLQKTFGPERVFDTILDEQTVLGTAIGSALNGFTPIPEIQYLAYLHNAEDQLRGEAATLSFFSNGQYQNPMVLRIASFGYQKGFGGHYHNDNSISVLRDIPGLVIAAPSHPADAGALLRTCIAAAQVDGTVSAFLEPIALYHTADLDEAEDRLWLAAPDASADHIPIGSARTFGDGSDLTILTWGNGLYMSLRVQRRVAEQHGIAVRVVDLRWLAPLPVQDILREATATGRVLVVDETRRTGGVGEGIITELVEHGFAGSMSRVSSKDSLIPLGDAANLVMLSERDVFDAVLGACDGDL